MRENKVNPKGDNAMKILLLIIISLGLGPIHANEQIGRIIKINGKVDKIDEYKLKSRLTNGSHLYQGDRIETQKGGYAKILMKDDTIFHVGPRSIFILEKLEMRKKDDRDASYNLVRGKLRSLFTVKNKKRSLIIKTPNVAMGVRGTEIVSDVFTIDGKVQSDIGLLSGKLFIQNDVFGDPKKGFYIAPGEMVVSSKGRGSDLIKNRKRKIKMETLQKMRTPSKKGGALFLFDALKERRKNTKKQIDFKFDPKIDDPREIQVSQNDKEQDQSKKVSHSTKILDRVKGKKGLNIVLKAANDEANKVSGKIISRVTGDVANSVAEKRASVMAKKYANSEILKKVDGFAKEGAQKAYDELGNKRMGKGVDSHAISNLASEKTQMKTKRFINGKDFYNKTQRFAQEQAEKAASKAASSAAGEAAMAGAQKAAIIKAEKKAKELGIKLSKDERRAVKESVRDAILDSSKKAALKAAKQASRVAARKAALEAAREAAIRASREAAILAAQEAARLAAKRAAILAARKAASETTMEITREQSIQQQEPISGTLDKTLSR